MQGHAAAAVTGGDAPETTTWWSDLFRKIYNPHPDIQVRQGRKQLFQPDDAWRENNLRYSQEKGKQLLLLADVLERLKDTKTRRQKSFFAPVPALTQEENKLIRREQIMYNNPLKTTGHVFDKRRWRQHQEKLQAAILQVQKAIKRTPTVRDNFYKYKFLENIQRFLISANEKDLKSCCGPYYTDKKYKIEEVDLSPLLNTRPRKYPATINSCWTELNGHKQVAKELRVMTTPTDPQNKSFVLAWTVPIEIEIHPRPDSDKDRVDGGDYKSKCPDQRGFIREAWIQKTTHHKYYKIWTFLTISIQYENDETKGFAKMTISAKIQNKYPPGKDGRDVYMVPGCVEEYVYDETFTKMPKDTSAVKRLKVLDLLVSVLMQCPTRYFGR